MSTEKGRDKRNDRMTQLLLRIEKPLHISAFSYTVDYTTFSYFIGSQYYPAQKVVHKKKKFHTATKYNEGNFLACITDEYNLFTSYAYKKLKDSQQDFRGGLVTYTIYQYNHKTKKNDFLVKLTANWFFDYKNKFSTHNIILTSSPNGEPDNTHQKGNYGNAPKASFTAFVGGAGDKYEFFLPPLNTLMPPTHIMGKCRDTFASSIRNIPHSQTKYYGYEEAYKDYSIGKKDNNQPLDNLLSDIKNILQNEPKTQINLVGHSLGGWNVAGLAEELYDKKICTVNCLITLDPVGTWASKAFVPTDTDSPDAKIRTAIYVFEPNPVSNIWVNIYADPESNDISDVVANGGRRWHNDTMKKAKYDYTTQAHHGEADEMFTTKYFEDNTLSASDILLREIKKTE